MVLMLEPEIPIVGIPGSTVLNRSCISKGPDGSPLTTQWLIADVGHHDWVRNHFINQQ